MPVPSGPGEWVRVEDADQYDRGGLLPMSVFLTKNSPGFARVRSNAATGWCALLGERIPAPPPNVPELPADETKLGKLTFARRSSTSSGRELRRLPRAIRFVWPGVRGYGPIGERRSRKISATTRSIPGPFPGGIEGEGLRVARLLRASLVSRTFSTTCAANCSLWPGARSELSDDAI